MKNIMVLLVGVGGYGAVSAGAIFREGEEHGCIPCGIVEPFLENSSLKDEIAARKIPVYDTLEAFYKENTADLAIISTPIHLHAEQCCYCMEHGSDVMCEKPTAPTLQEAEKMKECAKKTGKNLSIGFQLSHAPSILKMKQDIIDGVYGKCLSMTAMICWPRNSVYFARPWAAKATINGQILLDSIAMNACAHYLHNMFFMLGNKIDECAKPKIMGASVYRANDIETYDTAFIEVVTTEDVTLRFMATHACAQNIQPKIRCEFENGTIFIEECGEDNAITAVMKDGTQKNYGGTSIYRSNKLWLACHIVRGDAKPVCTVDTAMSHLKCINAISEFYKPEVFDNYELINDCKAVFGIEETICNAFEKGEMPALYKPEFLVDMTGYTKFGKIKE